jgi:hypothetical protein
MQVLQHRRIRQTPGTLAIAPFGRLLRPAVAYGDGYSNPPSQGTQKHLIWSNVTDNLSKLKRLALSSAETLSGRVLRSTLLALTRHYDRVCTNIMYILPCRPTFLTISHSYSHPLTPRSLILTYAIDMNTSRAPEEGAHSLSWPNGLIIIIIIIINPLY